MSYKMRMYLSVFEFSIPDVWRHAVSSTLFDDAMISSGCLDGVIPWNRQSFCRSSGGYGHRPSRVRGVVGDSVSLHVGRWPTRYNLISSLNRSFGNRIYYFRGRWDSLNTLVNWFINNIIMELYPCSQRRPWFVNGYFWICGFFSIE